MNEREDAIETMTIAKNRVAVFLRLSKNPDFQEFMEEVKKIRETYVGLLESPTADTKIDIIRGGLIATKDVMNITESLSSRSKRIRETLEELKEVDE